VLEKINSIPFQKNMLQKAASAVFTYLVTNPDNEVMQENLKFYSQLPEVDMMQVVNFEAQVRQKISTLLLSIYWHHTLLVVTLEQQWNLFSYVTTD